MSVADAFRNGLPDTNAGTFEGPLYSTPKVRGTGQSKNEAHAISRSCLSKAVLLRGGIHAHGDDDDDDDDADGGDNDDDGDFDF